MAHADELKALREEVERLRAALEETDARLTALEGPAVSEAAQVPESPQAAPKPNLRTPPPLPTTPHPAPMNRPVTAPRPPVPPPVTVPQGPDLSDRLYAYLKTLGPKEKMSLEMAIWTHWMPRIAMLLIGLGLVWGATYVSNVYGSAPWMPYARLGAGYLLSIGLLIGGLRVEAQHSAFARVVVGGAMGMVYFMTFAMHYVPATRIFAGPIPVLLLLGVLVASWAVVAHRRRSPLLACFMILAGQFTVGLSTFTLDSPSRFGAGAIIGLALLGALFLRLHRWYGVAALAMVTSYIGHFIWLAKSPASDAPLDFIISMAIILGYWLLFAGSELFAPESLRRRAIALRWRNLFVGFNTAAYVFIGSMTVRGFEFSRPYEYAFWWASGALLLGFGALYRWRRNDDPLQHVYLLKASGLITIGLALYFEGATLGLSILIEALVLLLGARKLALTVSRLASLVLVALAGLQIFDAYLSTSTVLYGTAGYGALFTTAVLVCLALFVYAEVYRTGQFNSGAPAWVAGHRKLRILAQYLELLPLEKTSGTFAITRVVGTYGAAYLGMLFIGLYGDVLIQKDHIMLAYAVPVVALGGYAAWSGSRPLAWAALIGVLFPLVGAWVGLRGQSPFWIVLPTGILLALHGLWVEPRFWGQRPGLAPFQKRFGPYLAYGAPLLFALFYGVHRFDLPASAGVLLGLAVVAYILSGPLHGRALTLWGSVVYLVAILLWADINTTSGFGWHAGALWIIVLGLCGERYLAVARFFSRSWLNTLLLAAGLLAGMAYGKVWLTDTHYLTWWAVLALLYLAWAGLFRQKAAGIMSFALAVLATSSFMLLNYVAAGPFQSWWLGVGPLLYWAAVERGFVWCARTSPADMPARLRDIPVSGIMAAVIAVLLVAMTSRTPVLNNYYLTIGWTVCAVVIIGYALLIRQPEFRYAGLALFALAIVRVVFIDSQNVEGIYRFVGVIVLGLTLLALAYGYVWVRGRQRSEKGPPPPLD